MDINLYYIVFMHMQLHATLRHDSARFAETRILIERRSADEVPFAGTFLNPSSM